MPVEPRPVEARLVTKIRAPRLAQGTFAPYALQALFPFAADVCWIWTGAFSKKKGKRYDKGADRPVIQLGRRGTPVVHVLRVMLSLKDGVPLWRREGLHACHAEACSNPACVNPFHGYWGSAGRNHQDRERYAPETFKQRARR